MEIQIDKNWKLTTDDMNVILCRRVEHKKKDAKGVDWSNVGYYQKIEHALELVMHLKEVRNVFSTTEKRNIRCSTKNP